MPPEDGGECVRTMFVSLEVYGDVRGPFPHHQTGYRLSLFRGDLDGFTRGSWVSIADDPYNKKPWAFFAPVDPVRLGIWIYGQMDLIRKSGASEGGRRKMYL